MGEGHSNTVKMYLHSMRSTFHRSVICNAGYDTASNLHDGKLRQTQSKKLEASQHGL